MNLVINIFFFFQLFCVCILCLIIVPLQGFSPVVWCLNPALCLSSLRLLSRQDILKLRPRSHLKPQVKQKHKTKTLSLGRE